MPQFERYIGIDYSGAKTPTSSLSGLRVYAADGPLPPKEVSPLQSPRKFWSRRGVAEFLRMELLGPKPVLVGIDHAFSFPMTYFEKYHLPLDWHAFLDEFQKHWPTDEDNTYVSFVREGAERTGDPTWLRFTELWTPAAKSVFQFGVQGQVATSTHAGLPWLRYLRAQCGSKVHFWPFEGWEVPFGRSAVVEVYPSLWMRRFPRDGRNADQHAAFSVAAWLQRADLNGWLPRYFDPPLTPEERAIAKVEGWILGLCEGAFQIMAPRYIMLFQFGSNMDPDRLNSPARLDGAAEIIGVAKLRGWGIRFDLYSGGNGCAVTDIVPSAREHVQGVLYRVPYRLVIAPQGQRSAMDKIEGAGLGKRSNYKRQKITVVTRGKKIEARTYVGTVSGRKRFLKKSDDERRVSDKYFGHVLAGAQRFHFSDRYILYLRKQTFR